MPTLQATTIGGKPILKAKWKIESFSGLAVGHVVHLNVAFDDELLVKALGKTNRERTILETEEDGYSVTLGFVVDRFTHLADVVLGQEKAGLDSMAWLKPTDRTMEAVLLYLFDPDSCDPKFVTSVRGKPVKDQSP